MTELRACLITAWCYSPSSTLWTTSSKLHGYSDGQYRISISSVASVSDLADLPAKPHVIVIADANGAGYNISADGAKQLEAYITANKCGLFGSYALFNKTIMHLFGLKENSSCSLETVTCSGQYTSLTSEARAIFGNNSTFTSKGYNWAQIYTNRKWVESGRVPSDLTTDNKVVAMAASDDGKAALLFYRGAAHRAMWWSTFPEYSGGSEDYATIGRSVIYLGMKSLLDSPAASVAASVSSAAEDQQTMYRVMVIGSNWQSSWKALNLDSFKDSNGKTMAVDYRDNIKLVDKNANIDVFVLPNSSGGNMTWTTEDGLLLEELAKKNRAGILSTYCQFQCSSYDNRHLMRLFGLDSSITLTYGSSNGEYTACSPEARQIFGGEKFCSKGYKYSQQPSSCNKWKSGGTIPGALPATDGGEAVRILAENSDSTCALLYYKAQNYRSLFFSTFPEYDDGKNDRDVLARAVLFVANKAGTKAASAATAAVAAAPSVSAAPPDPIVRITHICGLHASEWKSLNLDGKSDASGKRKFANVKYLSSIGDLIKDEPAPHIVVLLNPAGQGKSISEEEGKSLKAFLEKTGAALYTSYCTFSSGTDNKHLLPILGLDRSLGMTYKECGAEYFSNTSKAQLIFGGDKFFCHGYNYAQVPDSGDKWRDSVGGAIKGALPAQWGGQQIQILASSTDNRAALMYYQGPKYNALWWTSFPEWSSGSQDKEVFARALFFLADSSKRNEEEEKRNAEEARKKVEEEARKKAEEEKAAAEARRKAEEEKAAKEAEEKRKGRGEEEGRGGRGQAKKEEEERAKAAAVKPSATARPVSAARTASASRSGSPGGSQRPTTAVQRTVICAIEYNSKKYRLDAQVGNLQTVTQAICTKVGANIQDNIVEMFDPDLEDWFVLDSVDMLKEKAKIRVIPDKKARDAPRGAPSAELPKGPPKVGANRRIMAAVETQLALREYLKFPPGFSPKKNCIDELTSNAKILSLVEPDRLVKSCKEFIDDLKFADPPELKLVNQDELFAIVAYTYDLGNAKPEDNLYFKLNNDLRQRMKGKIDAWSGYLFYLLSGLGKLPGVSSTLYRGVPDDKKSAIEKEYAMNRRVRWTAFSSTTDDQRIAIENFAGAGGVVFRLKAGSGRNIQNLSYIKGEGEILLSPNITFRVVRPVHNEDGVLYLDLVEEVTDVFVF